MAPRDEHARGLPMDPGWERDQPDPNWSAGQYHGMRMRPGGRQAAYGFHRLSRERDLLAHGGFHGIYGAGPGRFDRTGAFRHPRLEQLGHRRQRLLSGTAARAESDDPGRVEDGGVRADNRYLRQYNAASPMLKDGHAQELGYGHAPGAEEGNPPLSESTTPGSPAPTRAG
jgi:hypothetical protein